MSWANRKPHYQAKSDHALKLLAAAGDKAAQAELNYRKAV